MIKQNNSKKKMQIYIAAVIILALIIFLIIYFLPCNILPKHASIEIESFQIDGKKLDISSFNANEKLDTILSKYRAVIDNDTKETDALKAPTRLSIILYDKNGVCVGGRIIAFNAEKEIIEGYVLGDIRNPVRRIQNGESLYYSLVQLFPDN